MGRPWSWGSAGFGCERYRAEKGRGGEGGGKEEGERGRERGRKGGRRRGGKMVINVLMTMHFG